MGNFPFDSTLEWIEISDIEGFHKRAQAYIVEMEQKIGKLEKAHLETFDLKIDE